MLTRIIRWLHSGRLASHPGLFFLEIAAALLSVLTLRDAILRGAPPSIEAVSAVTLWVALFISVICFSLGESNSRDK